MPSCEYLVTLPLQAILSDKRQNSQNLYPIPQIDTTKYFGSCGTEWVVLDLDWISESTILNFRIQIGYGVYEKFRIQSDCKISISAHHWLVLPTCDVPDSSAGLTVVANVAITTGPALMGSPGFFV